MKLQPRNNQVLVRVTKERKDGLSEGEVEAVGPGEWGQRSGIRESIDLKPGDHVLVDHEFYTSDRVPGMKGKHHVILERAIVAVILPDA